MVKFHVRIMMTCIHFKYYFWNNFVWFSSKLSPYLWGARVDGLMIELVMALQRICVGYF